jgi:tetratricopeptide (TPR) repeat protein
MSRCGSIPVSGEGKVFVSGDLLNEYPITTNKQKANLLRSLAGFYATNHINIDRAITFSKKAYELNPNSSDCISTLAWSYFKGTKYEKAYYTIEKLADKKGRVSRRHESRWKQIILKLPKGTFSLKIVSPSNGHITKEDHVSLKVIVSPNSYLSVNKSPYRLLKTNTFTSKFVLDPGDNHITVAAKKYLYGEETIRQSIKITWNKYEDNGDGTVTDLTTGLMWTKKTIVRTIWKKAKEVCRRLTIGGYSDWRLPTRNELKTIIKNGKLIDTPKRTYFPDIDHYNYWTSESINKDYAWTFYFRGGKFKQYGKWYHDAKAIAVRNVK